MADGILTVTGFGDFRKLHAEYNKLNAKNAEMERKLKDLTSVSKKHDDAQSSSIDAMHSKASAMIATYASARSAIQLATAALREQIDLQNRALSSTMTLADAQLELFKGMGPEATRQQMTDMAGRLQRLGVATGFGEAEMVMAGKHGFSATEGSVTPQRMDQVARMMKQLEPAFRSPGQKEDLGPFAGFALNVATAAEMTPERAGLVMLAAQGQTRITETGKLQNLVPAVAASALRARGAGAPESALPQVALENLAIQGVIGQMIADDTGELTSTAAILLDEILTEHAPKGMEAAGPLTIAKHIALGGDEKLRQKVISDVKGRGKTKVPQKAFLDMVDAMFARDRAENILANLDPTIEKGREFMKNLQGATPELQMATSGRKAATSQEYRVRNKFEGEGFARAMLFGGEFDGETMPGEFRTISGKGLLGLGDFVNRQAARAGFEYALMMGEDAYGASKTAVGMYLEAIGEKAQETRFDDIVKPLSETLIEIRKVTVDNLDASKNAIHAQNAAAAQGHRNGNQE